MTSSPADHDPAAAPLPDKDPGDEAGGGPSSADLTQPPAGAPDSQDTGGPDTQLAPDKD